MAGTDRKAAKGFGKKSDVRAVIEEHNDLVDDVEVLRKSVLAVMGDQVLTSAGAGVGVDAAPADIETTTAIVIRKGGMDWPVAVIAAIDISAMAAGGATISTSKHGVAWVFANTAAGADVEVDIDTSVHTTAIAAWAAWATATNTLPPGTDDVCIGAVHVEEGGSGAFTWGTDSITAETEEYKSFFGLPGVEVTVASLALDAAAATFTYGAVKVRLGDGTRVAATGKANVTISGTSVADTKTGAWLIYVLADDSEIAKQLGAAYATLAAAKDAVRDHNKNPYLAWIGTMYVVNTSGANFVPGTTELDAPGIATTFTTEKPPVSLVDVFSDLVASKVNV
ncbi:MAG: hypothetical protein A2Y38_18920 [Spirochaetes bacterium GWB1_59_5]|nr:MAG: hypothetical protein A2Y38_18920 [Spirochaetes bacterium GWB1_59_5]